MQEACDALTLRTETISQSQNLEKKCAHVTPEERAAVSVFQPLRLVSRLCYVIDRDTLAQVQAWLLVWQAEQEEAGG